MGDLGTVLPDVCVRRKLTHSLQSRRAKLCWRGGGVVSCSPPPPLSPPTLLNPLPCLFPSYFSFFLSCFVLSSHFLRSNSRPFLAISPNLLHVTHPNPTQPIPTPTTIPIPPIHYHPTHPNHTHSPLLKSNPLSSSLPHLTTPHPTRPTASRDGSNAFHSINSE